MPPQYAVIIPHYNDVERLDRCLKVLVGNDLSETEVLVVDNQSTVSLAEITKRYPMVRFLTETQKGAALARNTGVAASSAPILCFIDADCVPAENWLETAIKIHDRSDLVGGRVDVFDETPPPRSGAEAFETVFAFDMKSYIEHQNFTGSGNLITRRDVFEDVGGFKTGVSEDREWCLRAQSKGYKLVYAHDLVASHPSRQDWAALKHKWRRVTEELYGLNGTSLPARAKWALRALAMPLSAVVHTAKVLKHPELTGQGETRRAVLTLYRLRLLRMGWMLKQVMGLSL